MAMTVPGIASYCETASRKIFIRIGSDLPFLIVLSLDRLPCNFVYLANLEARFHRSLKERSSSRGDPLALVDESEKRKWFIKKEDCINDPKGAFSAGLLN